MDSWEYLEKVMSRRPIKNLQYAMPTVRTSMSVGSENSGESRLELQTASTKRANKVENSSKVSRCSPNTRLSNNFVDFTAVSCKIPKGRAEGGLNNRLSKCRSQSG